MSALQLEIIYERIEQLLKEKGSVIVVLEGGSAAGKTTMGKKIVEHFSGNLFHMDDFFLQPQQRTKERLEEPGGNVDRERFWQEVLEPLIHRKNIKYRRFDCCSQRVLKAVEVRHDRLTVIEGSYSMHEAFGRYYDLSVFLEIDSELQKKRIQNRNSPDKMERFLKEWIPMEIKYQKSMRVKERCEIVFKIEDEIQK